MEAARRPRRSLQEPVTERILARLRELGLTGYAARAYLALIIEPGVSAGRICKGTGIPDSKIYYALEELARHQLISVQQGNPSLYNPVGADQIAENLKQEAKVDFDRKTGVIESLAKEIEPLLASHADEKGVELAYIVKGRRNVLSHMIRAISASEREVLLMNSGRDLLEELLPPLQEARRHGLEVKLAVFGDPSIVRNLRFSEVKQSNCDCNILIADSKRLVTVTRHGGEIAYALITEDLNMISLSRSFYDNPACCAVVKPSATESRAQVRRGGISASDVIRSQS